MTSRERRGSRPADTPSHPGHTGALRIGFDLEDDAQSVAKLLARYGNIPISLADACLVRMTERHSKSRLLTLDANFRIYRKHRRQVIPTIMPQKM